MKKYLKILYFSFVSLLLVILFCNLVVYNAARGKLYRDFKNIPANKVGLVLGTSKYLHGGQLNLFFKYRINAAVDLYTNGKIQYILVSGDNSTHQYNEPKMMKEALIKAGIPDSVIVLDYAGFRTFDSVVRCKEVFGQSSVTVISQEFHNMRAILIGRKKDINIIGYDAQDVTKYNGFRVKLRESIARVLVVFDVYIFHRQPKFLGDPIQIG